MGGNIQYYDINDCQQYENLEDTETSYYAILEQKIPQEILSYLYNIAAD